jgi:hypothetical protein
MVALLAAAALVAPAQASVVYVGDSLGVGTLPVLMSRMPRVSFDGDTRIGRTSTEGLAVLRLRMRRRHSVVVFDLGTNDPAPATLSRNLRTLRGEVGARFIVVLTINKPGAAPFNRVLRNFAARGDNVALLDWHATAARERLLGGDGIHATGAGYVRRAAMVAACLKRERSPAAYASHARWPVVRDRDSAGSCTPSRT